MSKDIRQFLSQLTKSQSQITDFVVPDTRMSEAKRPVSHASPKPKPKRGRPKKLAASSAADNLSDSDSDAPDNIDSKKPKISLRR